MDKMIYKIGFWSGLVAFVSTVGYDVVQILQVVDVLRLLKIESDKYL